MEWFDEQSSSKLKSWIWQHYRLFKKGEVSTTLCKHCGKVQSCMSRILLVGIQEEVS